MNRQNYDVLLALYENNYTNQRELSQQTGHSLGIINKSLKELLKEELISFDTEKRIYNVTYKAKKAIKESSPKSAVILAAGLGMRMVPINTEVPKGLIEVKKEILIERLIVQLKEAGIKKIFVVVGFLKEKFEYLIDEYGVELVVNTEYAVKNNLHSMKLVTRYIGNTYIMPCDIWFAANPFKKHELYSWYMVSETKKKGSGLRVNKKMEIVATDKDEIGNADIGICYLTKNDAEYVKDRINKMCLNWQNDDIFWEQSLYLKDKMIVAAKVVTASEAIEINTYEQLREIDSSSSQLKTDAIEMITDNLHIDDNDIRNISVLKKGMTNRSFVFSCDSGKYIMRIPENGTEHLIDRYNEAEVYKTINKYDFCEDVVAINPNNGYKLSRYIDNVKPCDAQNLKDVEICMKLLRSFHKLGLKTKKKFDVFKEIEFYENLWGDNESLYRDYDKVRNQIMSLKKYIDSQHKENVLSHIDAVPENFLMVYKDDSKNCLSAHLIDWEYASMCDPHIDIAMFGIYSGYDRKKMDALIDMYFEGKCDKSTRKKIYCYVSACGLFWSNWCEYKRNQGTEFGEYSIKQYRYAKEYYRIVQSE